MNYCKKTTYNNCELQAIVNLPEKQVSGLEDSIMNIADKYHGKLFSKASYSQEICSKLCFSFAISKERDEFCSVVESILEFNHQYKQLA